MRRHPFRASFACFVICILVLDFYPPVSLEEDSTSLEEDSEPECCEDPGGPFLVPGIELLSRGWHGPRQKPAMGHVWQFTQDEKKTVQDDVSGRAFIVPDQVDCTPPILSCQSSASAHTTTVKSFQDLQNEIATSTQESYQASAGGGFAVKGFGVSVQTSWGGAASETEEAVTQQREAVEGYDTLLRTTAQAVAFRASLRLPLDDSQGKLKATAAFKAALEHLEHHGSLKAYDDFFETFGTHVVLSSNLGGEMIQDDFVRSRATTSYSMNRLKEVAQNSFNFGVSAGVGYEAQAPALAGSTCEGCQQEQAPSSDKSAQVGGSYSTAREQQFISGQAKAIEQEIRTDTQLKNVKFRGGVPHSDYQEWCESITLQSTLLSPVVVPMYSLLFSDVHAWNEIAQTGFVNDVPKVASGHRISYGGMRSIPATTKQFRSDFMKHWQRREYCHSRGWAKMSRKAGPHFKSSAEVTCTVMMGDFVQVGSDKPSCLSSRTIYTKSTFGRNHAWLRVGSGTTTSTPSRTNQQRDATCNDCASGYTNLKPKWNYANERFEVTFPAYMEHLILDVSCGPAALKCSCSDHSSGWNGVVTKPDDQPREEKGVVQAGLWSLLVTRNTLAFSAKSERKTFIDGNRFEANLLPSSGAPRAEGWGKYGTTDSLRSLPPTGDPAAQWLGSDSSESYDALLRFDVKRPSSSDHHIELVATCACDVGIFGDNCEFTKLGDCDPSLGSEARCSGHGHCFVSGGCLCNVHWSGPRCDTEILEPVVPQKTSWVSFAPGVQPLEQRMSVITAADQNPIAFNSLVSQSLLDSTDKFRVKSVEFIFDTFRSPDRLAVVKLTTQFGATKASSVVQPWSSSSWPTLATLNSHDIAKSNNWRSWSCDLGTDKWIVGFDFYVHTFGMWTLPVHARCHIGGPQNHQSSIDMGPLTNSELQRYEMRSMRVRADYTFVGFAGTYEVNMDKPHWYRYGRDDRARVDDNFVASLHLLEMTSSEE